MTLVLTRFQLNLNVTSGQDKKLRVEKLNTLLLLSSDLSGKVQGNKELLATSWSLQAPVGILKICFL